MRPRGWRQPARLLASLMLVATALGMAGEVRAPNLDVSSVQMYCDRFLDLEAYSRPSSGFEALSNSEQYRIAQQMAESARPLVELIDDLAPVAMQPNTAALVDGVDEVARTGDFRILGLRGGQAPEEDAKLGPRAARVMAALDALHDYNLENCAWRPQEVLGVDHAFHGVPDTLDAGIVSFEFRNEGRAPHTFGIERLQHAMSRDELVAQLQQREADKPANAPPAELTFTPGTTRYLGEAFAPAGKDDYLVLDLEPGAYVAVCFVPEGSTYISEENETLGTGPPHALSGMIETFNVR